MRHRFVPLVILCAACVQPASTVTTSSGGAVAPDTAAMGIALDPIEESAPLVELEVTSSERAGLYVIDMSGRPVYALVRTDITGPTGNSVAVDCTGACAQDFLPVIGRPRVGTNSAINPTILGTVRRGDGTRQVTLNGLPLWRYKGDQVSTHTRGHGMMIPGGSARLVWPDGKVVAEF